MIETRRIALDVRYNNIKLSGQVGADIESMTYVDSSADNSDSIDITLNAQNQKWAGTWMPDKGATLKPRIIGRNWEKPGDTRLISCGLFTLDDISFTGFPSTLQVGGVSKPSDNDFSEYEREVIWKNTSIKRIGQTIADRYGLGYTFDADDYDIECDEQDGTDSSYFNSLCKNYGLILKVYARRLWVYDREQYKEKRPVRTYHPSDMKRGSFSYTTTLSGTYTGGYFNYTDPDKDIDIVCAVGTAALSQPARSGGQDSVSSPPSTCRYGMKGETVKLMQGYLMQLGYDLPHYGADGTFLSETESAVKAFQAANPPLAVDGICGVQTWRELLEAINGKGGAQITAAAKNGHTKNVNRRATSVYDASVQLCAEINNANHGNTKVKFTVDGEWGVSAANCISLSGFGRRIDGKYFVDKVTHKVAGGSGYTADIEASRVETPLHYWDVGGSIEYHANEDAGSGGYQDNYKSTSPAANASSASAGAASGQTVTLTNAPFYASSTSASPASYKSGTYYYYDGILINGRYRITNSAARCGRLPVGENVTGWVPASYCTGGLMSEEKLLADIKARARAQSRSNG